MEYHKIINLFSKTPNQPCKFSLKNWVEINDDSRGMHCTDSQIKFKTMMLKSILCDYSNKYILVKGTITAPNTAGAGQAANTNNIEVIFKNCAPFTFCINDINKTQIDNAKDIDVVMLMYKFIENSHNYSKTSGSLWQYYRDQPHLNDNGVINNY